MSTRAAARSRASPAPPERSRARTPEARPEARRPLPLQEPRAAADHHAEGDPAQGTPREDRAG